MTLTDIEGNAIFKIKNNQIFDDHNDCVDISTEGRFYFKNGTYFLFYKEYNDIGEVSIMIRVKGDTVVIKRSGACEARMEYRAGFKDEVIYTVPFGDIVLDLDTKKVVNELDEENGGYFAVKYKLTVNGESYVNNLRIDVKL